MKPETVAIAFLLALGPWPGQAYAESRGGGVGVTANMVISSPASWTVLAAEGFNLESTSQCIAVASSDVVRPDAASEDQYYFVLSRDTLTPSPDDQSARKLELVGGLPDDGDTPDFVAISSTRFFPNVPAGAHTIRWQATKLEGGVANATVEDSSLSLMCFDGPEL